MRFQETGNRRNGIFSVQKEVFPVEKVSVDIQEIKPIQRITGSQYLGNFLREVILGITSII